MHTHIPEQRVVVGIDGSEPALAAVRWAAAEARRRHLSLRIVSACSWPKHTPRSEALGADIEQEIRWLTEEQLKAATEVARAADPEITVDQELVVGYPIPVLLAESENARLLVLGHGGPGAFSEAFTGTAAVALAARGACPVVVVRGRPATSGDQRPVVVGIDGTPTSETALAFAYEAAATRGVELVTVLTWHEEMIDPSIGKLLLWDPIEDWQRQVLAERLAGWAEKYPDVPVRRVVTRSRPVHRLLDEAQQAQLVVVGSRGRGALKGLLLGSVSHALVHRAPCPVAVVRSGTTDGEPGQA